MVSIAHTERNRVRQFNSNVNMTEEQADDTSSCSCEDGEQLPSSGKEYDEKSSDNDVEDKFRIIKSRQGMTPKIGDKGHTAIIYTLKAKTNNPSTSCSPRDNPTVNKFSVDADRPVTCNGNVRDTGTFSPSSVENKQVRTVVPYPSQLGSFKVCSQTMHKDFLYRPGDIVSLTGDNNRIYFAQIKALIENTFCEKYAALIWLLPNSPKFVQNAPFNPDLFIYGPQDENFYTLEAITFVMHAPTRYYKRFIPRVPESSNLTKPYNSEKNKRRRCKSKRDNIRLPVSIANLIGT